MNESSWVCSNWKYKIGNSARVRFWLDLWCGSTTLSMSFSDHFEMAVNKNETVAEVWDHSVGNRSWKLNFLRAFNDWELDQVANLLCTLQ